MFKEEKSQSTSQSATLIHCKKAKQAKAEASKRKKWPLAYKLMKQRI